MMKRKSKMHSEEEFDLDNVYNEEQIYGMSHQNAGWTA